MGKKKKPFQLVSQEKLATSRKEATCSQPTMMSATLWLLAHSTIVLAVYVYTMYPSVSGGDSGELIAVAHELGVAHPPGYPVFTLLIWLAIKVVPLGSVAWRANLLNAVLSALATLIFSLTLYRYTKSVGLSMIGASLWSINKLTWTWSTCIEVFSLNNVFIATLLYLMVKFETVHEDGKLKVSFLGSFMCGLSLCNQHTSIVYVAAIALWVLSHLYKLKKLTPSILLLLAVCFLCGLVPYIYLPLSSRMHTARWTWGNQSSIEGFFTHILRKEYGTFSLAKSATDESSYCIIDGLRMYGGHVVSEFTIFGAVLAVVGAVDAIKSRCASIIVSMVMCILYLILFSWRANLNLNNQLYLGVVERFWMQSDIIIVLLAVVGLSSSYKLLKRWWSARSISALEVASAVAVFAAYIGRNFSECNQRNNTVIEEFGSRLFHNMPPNTLVLTVGDLPSNVLRYLYLCENERSDVTVLDQELLTYSWFVPMLRHAFPTVTFPGHHMELHNGHLENGQAVFNFKAFLDANYNSRPIIGCIGLQGHDKSWQQSYYQFPYGPCSLVMHSQGGVDVDSIRDGAGNISTGWNYPHEGFDAKSWERVATNEMWNAKVNFALQIFEMAMRWNETDENYLRLIIKSYELYKQAVDRESLDAIPDYWHRNYALACERMLSIDHKYSKNSILNDTIFHFEMYVKKNPTDKSVPIIEQSIARLKLYDGKL